MVGGVVQDRRGLRPAPGGPLLRREPDGGEHRAGRRGSRFRVAQVHRPDLRHMSGCCRAIFRMVPGGTWSCSKCGSPFAGEKLVSRATVNRLFWAMAAFGVWSIERRYHLSNPWSVVSFAEDALPPPSVTEQDLAAVFKALEHRGQSTFPWRALFEFARETGLRRSELGRLARVDIEEGERRAWVVSSHRRGQNKGRRLRSVALTSRALAILHELPEREDGLVCGRIPDKRRAFASGGTGRGPRARVAPPHAPHGRDRDRPCGRVARSIDGVRRLEPPPRMAQRCSQSPATRDRRLEGGGPGHAQSPAAPEKETGGRDLSQPPVSAVDPTRIELVTS